MGRYRTKDKHLPPRMRLQRGRYYWIPFVDGKQKSYPLGDDYIQALMKYRDLEGLNEGAASIKQLLENALAAMADAVKPSTFKEYARACNAIAPVFEGFAPADVKPHHMQTYLDKRRRKMRDGTTRPAPVTANRELTFFSAAWDLARRRGWTNLPNPAAGVKRHKERSRKRIARPGEIAALLAGDSALIDMLTITLKTGMREADLLNLTLHQLEAEGIRVKPRKTDASTEAEQVFLWDSQLREAVERAKGRRKRVGSIYLFPVTRRAKAGQPYTVGSFQNIWRRHFAKCGVTGLTWHDIRRTALNLKEREQGKQAAQEMAAHSSMVTTEGYLAGVGAVNVRPVVLDFGRKGG